MDDLLIMAKKESVVNGFMRPFDNQFILKALGRASKFTQKFLGKAIDYEDHRGIVIVNEAAAIQRCLGKHGMTDCQQILKPMEKNVSRKFTKRVENDIRHLLSRGQYITTVLEAMHKTRNRVFHR